MRIMLKARMGLEKANALAREGKLGSTIQTILDELKPEAVYFTDDWGTRTAFIFVDIKDVSQIPQIAEPWFLALDAQVEMHPVMKPEDLAKASAYIERAAKKYGG